MSKTENHMNPPPIIETGWLIEHNDCHSGHRWLRAVRVYSPTTVPRYDLEWHSDANVALRFAREEDARAFLYLHKDFCVDCRLTCHQFGV